jgi:hypothetical protein
MKPNCCIFLKKASWYGSINIIVNILKTTNTDINLLQYGFSFFAFHSKWVEHAPNIATIKQTRFNSMVEHMHASSNIWIE